MEKMNYDDAISTADAIKLIFYEVGENKKIQERIFPFGLKYKLIKIKSEFEKVLSDFIEAKNELIKKYGENFKDEKGEENIKVKESELEKFYIDYNELLKIEIELNYIRLNKIDLEKIKEKEIDIPESYIKFLIKFIFEEI